MHIPDQAIRVLLGLRVPNQVVCRVGLLGQGDGWLGRGGSSAAAAMVVVAATASSTHMGPGTEGMLMMGVVVVVVAVPEGFKETIFEG